MTRLILTTSDSGAGCLKASRTADDVIGFGHRLVSGPIPPASDPVSFFSARARLTGAESAHAEEEPHGAITSGDWLGLLNKCRISDRVEIWVDPVPNAQLQLVQLLDWLAIYPDIIAKLLLAQLDFLIGEREPEEIRSLDPLFRSVDRAHVRAATMAWRAFQQPTPEGWFELLKHDFGAFPYLHGTVSSLLEELPAAGTGLTTSETKLIKTISAGVTRPLAVLAEQIAATPRSPFDYWELGSSLGHLAHCERPAVLGLADGPFTLAMHDDSSRFAAYRNSILTLSELGQALVEGRVDFSRYNTINRWWGGTRLVNERLWRWDAANKMLLSPY